MTRSECEVVVVGGGAAGIAAARRLREAGVDCLLLEARQRLGGRAWTVQDPSGLPIDLGCGWLHSGDRNPWRSIFESEGRTIDRTPPPWARPSIQAGFPAGGQAAFSEARNAFNERLEAAAERQPDATAATLLEPGNRWNGLIGAVGTYISGAELELVSIRDLGRYADSGVNWRVAEGYGACIVAYGAALPAALGCPVTRIDHGGRRIAVETPRGAIAADQVIVTLPSTVLAETDDLFRPALPAKTKAAAGLPLGLADKLFLSLRGGDDIEADSRLFGRTDRVATGAYHMRPFGRPQIEAYYAGALAADLEAGGETAFIDFARAELTGLLGGDFARRIDAIAIHHWGSDPLARGSYSFASPGQADCRDALAAPVENRLFFAGEACSRHDYSTAHGAYLTGIAAADAVIAARR